MLIDKIHSALPNLTINKYFPLSKVCTFRTGGEAEIFVAPDSIKDAKIIFSLAIQDRCPVYILGGGSNVLFPDDLLRGIVISTLNLRKITWLTDFTAEIEAGVMLPSLMKKIREKGLGGIEFAAGIPGTIGGAISGNAGAGGHGICELVDEVLTLESDNATKTWHKNEINYSYRKCSLNNNKRMIISARMTFRKANPDDKNIYESFILKRTSQPRVIGNAGCTFKNPEGFSAGKLLDECGCKNLRVGDAIVSDQHANFIINLGNAKSSDIMKLIKTCSDRVYDKTGIKLEPEIRIFAPTSGL